MTNCVKAGGRASILAVALASTASALAATPLDHGVHQVKAVMTELDTNASAIIYWVSESDGWHVVTTVDAVMGQRGDAEKQPLCAFPRCCGPASHS